MRLYQKTILITGGTSGIGLELARQLHQRDNTIIVTGRNQAALDAIQRALPEIHIFRSDVSDPAAIAVLHSDVLARFPELDVLINNAGIMRKLDFGQGIDSGNVASEIEINFSGPVRMIQQFLPHLKTREDALIVNVSSALAFVPLPASPVYCATKAALHSFTLSLRVQLAGSSVTVVELAPPAVMTPMIDQFAQEMKERKVMDVKVVASNTIAGIEAGHLEIRPGMSNTLHYLSRIAPRFSLNQMAKMTKVSN